MALTSLGWLTHDQRSGSKGVAAIYKVATEQTDQNSETIQGASTELKKLYSVKDAMRIDEDGVVENRFVKNQ